jgi:hypothetical protein
MERLKHMHGFEAEISVDGQKWQQVGSFSDAGPNDQVYVVDKDSGRINFGDGAHGSRPPDGSSVNAVYRTGAGASGSIVSLTFTADMEQAFMYTVLANPGGVQLSIHQAREHSWRWRIGTWLCAMLKRVCFNQKR